MTRVIVVCGTDTGVGKTIATAALAAREAGLGRRVLVVKPAQTGVGGDWPDPPDADTVTALTGLPARHLVALADPLAPDTAARLRDVTLPTVAEHAASLRALLPEHDTVVVEGAGGLLVRIDTEGGTLLDLAVALAPDADPLEVVVVARPGLGTLNHTELTVAALRARGVEPAGVVLGSWPAAPGLAERCNREDLPRVTGLPLLAVIPDGAGALSREEFLAGVPAWFA